MSGEPPPPSSPPPGWYPDPDPRSKGGQRWWTGTEWGPPAHVAATQPNAPSAPHPTSDVQRGLRFGAGFAVSWVVVMTVLSLLAVVVVIGGCAALIASSGSET